MRITDETVRDGIKRFRRVGAMDAPLALALLDLLDLRAAARPFLIDPGNYEIQGGGPDVVVRVEIKDMETLRAALGRGEGEGKGKEE
jgi:hypothetical protein